MKASGPQVCAPRVHPGPQAESYLRGCKGGNGVVKSAGELTGKTNTKQKGVPRSVENKSERTDHGTKAMGQKR